MTYQKSLIKQMHIIIALAMIFTGIAYPLEPYWSYQSLIFKHFGFLGLLIFSSACLISGLLLMANLNTKQTFFYTIPLWLFVWFTVFNYMFSLTAIVVYASLWVIPNYVTFLNKNGYVRNGTIKYWMLRVKPAQIIGSWVFLMWLMLLIRPDGPGINFIIGKLDFFDDPITIYQLSFGVGSLLLFIGHRVSDYSIVFLLSSPLLFHTGLLSIIVMTDTFAWSVLPFLLASFCMNILFISEYY